MAISIENLVLENRKGIPGGLGRSTNLPYDFAFIDINSDHDAMFIELKKRIKSEKMIDYSKLSTALTDGVNLKINKDIYKINRKWTNDNGNIRISENNKIIILAKENLSIDPYLKIYNHNPMK